MINQPLVWVVGDSMLDVSIHRDRFRRTPENATVPILPAASSAAPGPGVAAGGAANVAVNLDALLCRVVLFTNYGPDWAGDVLHSLLEDVNVVAHGQRTTVKARYYEGDRLVARVDDDHDDREILPPPDPPEQPDAVIVTDYGRGAVSRKSLEKWVAWCDARNIPIYGDPKIGRTILWSALPSVIMVANYQEAVELLGVPGTQTKPTLADAGRICARLYQSNFRFLVVKCGAAGSVWGARAGWSPVQPVQPQEVFDVQGAGDTYIAALVAARSRGLEFPDACLFASAAAGVAVGVPGTATVILRRVLDALKPMLEQPGRILTVKSAQAEAQRLKKFGYLIGMTGGCFDLALPHPGHISTISRAAELCDYLFVAVDSDARVRGLKGPYRPVNPIGDRLTAMSSLRGVHVAFEFDTEPTEVVDGIRPDVLVKSEEYRTKPFPEADHLGAWGGRVEFVPVVQTPSTTQRLKESP